MKALCIVLMLCSHGHFKPMNAAVLASAELDAAATYYDLHNCGNCYEAKPFVNGPQIFLFEYAGAEALNFVAERLAARHGRLARAIQFVAVGAHVGAGINNLRALE